MKNSTEIPISGTVKAPPGEFFNLKFPQDPLGDKWQDNTGLLYCLRFNAE